MTSESWDDRIHRAELRHGRRRARAAWGYRLLERVFFGALVLLACLILLKFGAAVLPEFFR